MPKLTPEQRSELRMSLRTVLESGKDISRGLQTRLAEQYDVTRQYINQIVKDERKRLKNPIAWEAEKAKKRKEKINILELIEKTKDHPAFAARPEK